MITKRVLILTHNSASNLSKVYTTQTLTLFRNFSVSAQRLDSHDLKRCQVDQYDQNANGFYGETENLNELRKNADGQSLNPSRGFRQSPKNEFFKDSNSQSGIFGQEYENNSGDLRRNSNGFYSGGGAYSQSCRSDNRNDGDWRNENSSGHYGQNMKDLGRNIPDGHARTTDAFHRSTSGGQHQQNFGQSQYNSNFRQTEQNTSREYYQLDQCGGQYQPSVNAGQYQQNSGGGQMNQNVGIHHSSPSSGQYQQNSGGGRYEMNQNVGVHQPTPSSRQYQQNSVGENQNFWQYHPTPNARQHLQNSVGGHSQLKQNVGHYQPSPNAGQYQHNSVGGQCQQNQNVGQYQSILNAGHYQQNISVAGHYEVNQNVQQYQASASASAGQNQQNSVGGQYYSAIAGLRQQFPRAGQYQQISNSGESQQSPDFSQSPQVTGQYWSNSTDIHVNSHAATDAKPEAELSASDSTTNQDTIEQLDGFCAEGNVKEAVEALELLVKKGFAVDLPRYEKLMQACGDAKALAEAKVVHEHIIRSFFPLQVSTYNKILEMYGQCGSMDDAFSVFDKMSERNLTSWGTMITWLAKNGLGEDAIDLFTEFKRAGLKPDGQIFIGVFSACGVLGDVNEGMLHFETMSKEFGISPTMEHYVSIVNMLGTTGHLDEAFEFIEKIPVEPSVGVWETLMNLCRIHGNLELGDRCAKIIEMLDPSYLNEQTKAGFLPAKPAKIIKEKKKLDALSPPDIKSRIYEYRAGDTSHPDSDKYYALLRGMKEQMKEGGYIPETRFVLHDVDQETKEDALLGHSERLAVAHGLLNSQARSQIRIMKNLRVCGDCHTALKMIAKIVGREFIIRDAKRFHHFKDGVCSCRDYW